MKKCLFAIYMENELGYRYEQPDEYADVNAFPELGFDASCPPRLKPPNPGGLPVVNGGFKPQDRLAAALAISMYEPNPVYEAAGFSLMGYSPHVSSWTQGETAMVAIRGTSIGKRGGLQDLLDDYNIAFGVGCDLELVKEARDVLNELAAGGITRFILSGHSLGGRAAICLGNFPGVVNVVALNPGAPLLNPDYANTEIGTTYHIVGDIISTHVYGMDVVRIKTREVIDWLDPFFHSSKRFLASQEWEIVGPQYEQDQLQDFFLKSSRAKLELISIGTSFFYDGWFQAMKDGMCTTPIPGAKVDEALCAHSRVIDSAQRVSAALVGFIIGFAFGGPDGAVSGVKAGWGFGGGASLAATMEEILPGYEDQSRKVKKALLALAKASRTPKEFIYKLKKIQLEYANKSV
jgi:hypothetical protein